MKTDFLQRCTGTFYTPLPFAERALEYIERHFTPLPGSAVRLWDAAAGTGHLEHYLPPDMLKHCYLSTLEQNDVQTLQAKFPGAAAFQYDYLNGKTEQLPVPLQNDLANRAVQWLILVNPPYATAQDAALGKKTKDSVADTLIRGKMHAEKLGEVSRELYTQFLYRIKKEFKDKTALLGVFAPLKYLVSGNYQKFRDNVFHCGFRGGFVFSSANFGGTSAAGNFPVSFIVWDINDERRIDSQDIVLDVLDENAEKTGVKKLRFADRSQFLNRWIKRPPAVQVFPPFGSALTVKENNKDVRNRIADGFLASMMCPGNELQCQQKTVLLSGPQASAGAFSVVPDNFEQAMVVFAARRVPKDHWLQHVDQFLQPNRELPPEFITDCAVWTLFDSKNQTVALRNVKYHNKVYQIENHLFPFALPEVQRGTSGNIPDNRKESFAAKWLTQRQFSPAARNVLEAGKAVYRLYFRERNRLPLEKYRIETADAGLRQIMLALQDAGQGRNESAVLKERHEKLRVMILPQLKDYGIL
ncbi:MAG: hypothetical protein LBN39_07465 [Planctomycetaceae bacterium]|nr:hypothetical protein [Planctomycetaceae bacterium]